MAATVTQSINSKDMYLKINSQDVSAAVMKVTFPSSWQANKITAAGSVGVRYHGGIDETKFTVEAMFNQIATTGWHTVVGAVHAAKSTVAFEFGPAGTVTGNTKISGNCVIPVYQVEPEMENIIKAHAEIYVDNGLTFGTY